VRFILILSLLLSFNPMVSSATQDSVLYISGKAYNSIQPDRRLEDLMIINLRTSNGIFGKADGTFSLTVFPTDTFMVASTGYEFKKFCFRDSLAGKSYYLDVPLTKLNVELKEVVIFSPRELNAIYKEIERLGYNKKDFQLSGINVLQSPITFLYQEFSKLEQLKRHNAERINDDKRRQLFKELLINYVSYDIIQLDDDEFDAFIDYCNVPEYYLKTASQYDFCIYVKQKFVVYQSMKPRKW
jgi:hypothetical protein